MSGKRDKSVDSHGKFWKLEERLENLQGTCREILKVLSIVREISFVAKPVSTIFQIEKNKNK